jgi:cysteine desulfurase
MKNVYLDNAATTALRPQVIKEMTTVLETVFGNPSSTHAPGRQARSVIEMARKNVASLLNCSSQEIIFTSGGTEADNWIITSAIQRLGVRRIITSKIEHHAVLHTVEHCACENVSVAQVRIKKDGSVDYEHLQELLSADVKTLVTLMHVNNEIGTQLDLDLVGNMCRNAGALFHSDTVQSMGKTVFDLQELPIDFLVASAHKFHGPKGVGFAYVRKGLALSAIFHGGEQEKGYRAGTEGIHNIAGLSKALELSYLHLDEERAYIQELKNYTIQSLMQAFPMAKFNGENTFYNIVNVCLPFTEDKTAMILFTLDLKGIALSRGSACQSGSPKPSHVLAEILDQDDLKKPSLRISFSHFNTSDDVDYLIQALKSI